MTPTARTLKLLRQSGYTAAVAERWIPGAGGSSRARRRSSAEPRRLRPASIRVTPCHHVVGTIARGFLEQGDDALQVRAPVIDVAPRSVGWVGRYPVRAGLAHVGFQPRWPFLAREGVPYHHLAGVQRDCGF